MKTVSMGILIILTMFFLIPQGVYAQQEIEPGPQNEQKSVIHPGPQDMVEKIGISVFLAWIWISIVVLIYFLRLKIKEADRLYELRFYETNKKGSSF